MRAHIGGHGRRVMIGDHQGEQKRRVRVDTHGSGAAVAIFTDYLSAADVQPGLREKALEIGIDVRPWAFSQGLGRRRREGGDDLSPRRDRDTFAILDHPENRGKLAADLAD